MKGLFIPEITAEMFRNGCLESIEALMAEGEIYDIEYDPKSAEPECKTEKWIPCSKPPKESGTYIVTAYDGTNKRVSFVKYQKTLKRWDLTGARAYWRILTYKPLPEPWKGEQP